MWSCAIFFFASFFYSLAFQCFKIFFSMFLFENVKYAKTINTPRCQMTFFVLVQSRKLHRHIFNFYALGQLPSTGVCVVVVVYIFKRDFLSVCIYWEKIKKHINFNECQVLRKTSICLFDR